MRITRRSVGALTAACLATMAVLPAIAPAATVTNPASKGISFGPVKVKKFKLSGTAIKGGAIFISLTRGGETVSLSSTSGFNVKVGKDLTGSLTADLKDFGKIDMEFKSSKDVKTLKPGKGCTGDDGKRRRGKLEGSFSVNLRDTYFKTIGKSKLKATAFKTGETKCTVPDTPPGGSDKTTYLSSSPTGLFASFAKAPNGKVTQTISMSGGEGPGPSISRFVTATGPASSFTVASNAKTATVNGLGPVLSGKLNYTANQLYPGGSSGKAKGDFAVKFTGLAVKRPWSGAGFEAFLTKPGFVPPNQKPTADFVASESFPGTQEYDFDALGSFDPDGTIASYRWSFGDGATGTGAFASHKYATGGTYSVTLTVKDNRGATTSTTKNVVVAANQAPVAGFSCDPDDPGYSFDVTCDPTTSADDGGIVDWAWNFGDGTPVVTGEEVPTHSYAAAGIYTVTLTVTDNGGKTDSESQQVEVPELEPEP